MAHSFTQPPPAVRDAVVAFPQPHVLLVRLDRPKQLNAVTTQMHHDLDALWAWLDAEPSLRCAVLTGTGRAFSAGADLKQWDDKNAAHQSRETAHGTGQPASGFGGLSNRRGKKPIIAAVNGLCLGGALEMAINLDMVLATETAQFGLPEVSRGAVAIAGALPRLIRSVGRQRASEMAMLGRMYTAADMHRWGLVNAVVPTGADVVAEALRWAGELASNSPDSVVVSRHGLLGGWAAEDPVDSTARVQAGIYRGLEAGENIKEGVRSFVEKRKPVWRDSKL